MWRDVSEHMEQRLAEHVRQTFASMHIPVCTAAGFIFGNYILSNTFDYAGAGEGDVPYMYMFTYSFSLAPQIL